MRQGVVGSGCNGCRIPSLVLFVSSSYVALGENFEAKAWDRICRRPLLLDKLSMFLFTLRIVPTGE